MGGGGAIGGCRCARGSCFASPPEAVLGRPRDGRRLVPAAQALRQPFRSEESFCSASSSSLDV